MNVPMKLITAPEPTTDEPAVLLSNLAHRAFAFFWNASHPDTGLTKDRAKNRGGDTYTVASIASTGYALANLPIAVERGWISRKDAQERARRTLAFLKKMESQHGFFYHFVDWRTGKRVWECELSSIDSGLLMLGALVAGQYFGGDIRARADALFARMDWRWMQNRNADDPPSRSLTMGWKPKTGFLDARWEGYSEASYLYLLALSSPTFALPPSAWDAWKTPLVELEGFPVLGGPGPIFMAQMTPAYYDLRGKRDRQGRDWWTNFANAHRANLAYCKRQTNNRTYRDGYWGITACDQPPPVGYGAQEPVDGKNDGTVAPTGMLAGILFVPDAVKVSARQMYRNLKPKLWGRYGFGNAFNVEKSWYDADVLGIDLGMMSLAIENARTGLIWRLVGEHPALRRGIAAAGFYKG